MGITSRSQDGWTDFYFGDPDPTTQYHSLLSAKAKVALHYHPADLIAIQHMECPSTEIPAALWQQLVGQGLRSQRILNY